MNVVNTQFDDMIYVISGDEGVCIDMSSGEFSFQPIEPEQISIIVKAVALGHRRVLFPVVDALAMEALNEGN